MTDDTRGRGVTGSTPANQAGGAGSSPADRSERIAAQGRRFTVEGDPSDVLAFAERAGLTITHPRWWQRTYAVRRWVVWATVVWWILGLPRGIETLIGWLS